MKDNPTKKPLTYILTACLLISLCGCNSHRDSNKRIIATSIVPIQYFIESIVGDTWQVIAIIPSNANHTSYEPTTQNLRDVSDACIYFETGNIGFEDSWTQRFKSLAKDCKFTDVSENIEKIGGHYHNGEYHGADPHYWLSPSEALVIAENIYNTIAGYDTANKDTYYENYMSLRERIIDTDRKVAGILADKNNDSFLVYHPALTYFAHHYGLNQVAIEDNGKEPSASHIAEIVTFAKDNNIKVILYQSQYAGTSVKNIADEIGAAAVCYDPMAHDWCENMVKIAKILTR